MSVHFLVMSMSVTVTESALGSERGTSPRGVYCEPLERELFLTLLRCQEFREEEVAGGAEVGVLGVELVDELELWLYDALELVNEVLRGLC